MIKYFLIFGLIKKYLFTDSQQEEEKATVFRIIQGRYD